MDENKRFVTGLDIGTENVRAVIATVDRNGETTVVGFSEGKSAGMRKGVPANLAGPVGAIERMIVDAERMGGYEVKDAFVSVGGSQIASTRAEGMIAVGTVDHEINLDDLVRVEEITVSGSALTNREVLDVIPLEYRLDGQGGIKDPQGMSGARLEMRANIISAVAQSCENLKKVTMELNIRTDRLVPGAVAAARAVLTDRQRENGVAVIDMGAATTSVAVYEEGDLQYVGVVPAGSNNVTNDLAIVLAIDPEMAEEIKTRFVTGDFDTEKSPVIRVGKEGKAERAFERKEVEEVVEARLTEIFEEIRKKLKTARYDQRLPEGVVLTGGGAKMRDIDLFAKKCLEAAVKIGVPQGMGGVSESIEKPEFAVAVGLAQMAAEQGETLMEGGKKRKLKKPKMGKSAGKVGMLKKILDKF